ncbi:hypothetical protein [Frondihabitans sucicola]|uniref:hypothetical protein n=1 Tax=Frondihabitans sucicola TaxID=1268041 RepID=UPI0025736764|nr:hypothetical protein [Frondihabitans sucicola]
MSDREQAIDRLDKQLWRIRWWPLIPLAVIVALCSARWGTMGFVASLVFAVIVAGVLYFVRMPLNARRLQLINDDSSASDPE